MKKIIIISIVVHVLFLALFAPYLKSKMEFDKLEEAQRTEEVRKRELARQEYEKLKREKQKLDEKTARQLKKEAERKKREAIAKRFEELKKLRDEMLERQEKALAELKKRTRENIIDAEATDFRQDAKEIVERTSRMTSAMNRRSFNIGAYQNGHDWGANGQFDRFQVFQEALEPPFDTHQPIHHFDFDGNATDRITDQSGELHHGAKLIDLPNGSGGAFQSNGSNARIEFWPFKVEENFTLVTRLKLQVKDGNDAKKHQGLLANNHSDEFNKGFRVFVEPTSADAKGGTVVLQTTGEERALATRSLPKALTFDEWHEVALVINRQEDWAKIFIDGRDVTAPDSELAEDFPTENTTLDGTSQKMAEALQENVESDPPTPENAGDYQEELSDLDDKLDQRMEEHPTQHDVRHDITKAKDAIAKMEKTIEGLTQKTDVAKMNDTSASVADKMDPGQGTDPSTPAELYQEAREVEQQIAEAYADISAAKKAATENTSFSEARNTTHSATPNRPDLAGKLGDGSSAPATVGELNELRDNLQRASNEVSDMAARAQSMLGGASDRSLASSAMKNGGQFASFAARQRLASSTDRYGAVVDMTTFGLGDTDGDSTGLRADISGEGAAMAAGKKQESIRLNEHDIIAKALPGRRFTEESARRGWLYIDTWYVIGPWENDSKVNFEQSHPPEYEINYDARYLDGKFADQENHPDQVLKWNFYQSDSVRCQPPRVYGAASYYAYTELWFEEAREMLIAVASDDAASMWLNDQIVWQDTGQSSWSLGEGYRRVNMRKGYNTLLVRIENGPVHCVWSVLLCPPDANQK
jgi:hypothetical protein